MRYLLILVTGLIFITGVQCTRSQRITESLRVSKGAVNGVTVTRNGHNLVVYGDPEKRLRKADMVLFTHHRRDVIWAGRDLVMNGSQAIIPFLEKPYFTDVDSIWNDYSRARFHNYYCQTTKIPAEPIKSGKTVTGGDILKWQDIEINVLNTPGYTRGSVTYTMDLDGKKYAFTGDLITGDGKIPDLYSFQDSLDNIAGYHGYATRLGQLISGLQLVAGQKPDIIIPARGEIITDPQESIAKLIGRIRAVYSNYLSLSAYRWYFPERMQTMSDHVIGKNAAVQSIAYADVLKSNPPSWYMHISNTNLVVSDDGSAFVIDCGTESAFREINRLTDSGSIKSIDGVFVTHYHDDHTDYINKITEKYGCPVYVTPQLKDIIENPSDFNLPCLTHEHINGLKIMEDKSKMTWKDFIITFFYFPGQTIYHDAVLFEKNNGEKIFFTGDSFTPSGIDDYCLLNRNLLHPGMGYFQCLDILKELPENVLLSNQHVEPLFSFSDQQLKQLADSLRKRTELLRELIDWDNINYGIDEQWIRIHPYSQQVCDGKVAEYTVKIFNHSDTVREFTLEPEMPEGFRIEPERSTVNISPKQTGELTFSVTASGKVRPGIHIMLADVRTGNRILREWCEAMIEVTP